MIIDIIKLKQELGGEGQFNFDYLPPNDLITSLPDAKFVDPAKVSVYCQLNGKDVYADINISYKVYGKCSRCLDDAVGNVNYSFQTKFSLMDDGEDCYLYKGGKVDLTECVNEAILLSQPSVIYCKEDCKGLCPLCGANLNKVDCGHHIKIN